MVLVRSIVTSSGEQEYKNLCMFFNINGVGKIIYGYNSTFVHRGYNNTLCTMKELCYYFNVWPSLRFVEESEALHSMNLYR